MEYKEKKVAIAIPNLGMGGAERVASELANQYVKNGIDVSIILLDDNDIYYQLDDRIKVTFIDYNKEKSTVFRNIERIRKFRKFVKDNSIDIVISLLTSANFLAILSTRRTNAKVYVSERNDPNSVSKKIKRIRNFLYRFADGAIFQTHGAKEYFPNRIQKKSTVIGNPIKENLPQWDSVEEHNKTIVTAVRLEKPKNIPMLIEAFNKVKVLHDDYKLIIYGDGMEYDNIKEQITKLNLEEYVLLKGKCNNWHDEAIKSTMFVLSSDHEGMSNSLLEALAMGMPVVSTDHPIGGARAVIDSGKNGFLVPVKDSDSLANAMMKLIESKELQIRFSNEAKKISDEMSVEKISEKWLEYILKN